MLGRVTQHGIRHTVAMIPGDGVGAELCAAVRAVFSARCVPVDFDEDLAKAVAAMHRHCVGIKGAVYTPHDGPQRSLNAALRRALDLYANVVHITAVPLAGAAPENVDIALIRENIEGEYAGLEHAPVDGVVESLKVVTETRTRRLVRFALDYARSHGRRRVTAVHKANIMKRTDGLFLRVFREMAAEERAARPELVADDMIVDNAAMQLVSRPEQFDVVVAMNLYGSVLANIGAGLVGGPGLVPGYNMGAGAVIYEPGVRHVARDIAGRGTANPASMLLASAHMLRHLGHTQDADAIERAVRAVLAAGKDLTPDVSSDARGTTSSFVSAVIGALSAA